MVRSRAATGYAHERCDGVAVALLTMLGRRHTGVDPAMAQEDTLEEILKGQASAMADAQKEIRAAAGRVVASIFVVGVVVIGLLVALVVFAARGSECDRAYRDHNERLFSLSVNEELLEACSGINR